MAGYNLGTARGIIELDYHGNGAADKAAGDFDKISKAGGKSADKTKGALKEASTGMLVAGGGIVAGLALAVKSAADFEQGMSGIKAVSGATAAEMDSIRAKALKLGADTAFSASEAGLAMEELVKAGLPIKDVLAGAADATVALAAAGGIALPEAATIAANAMNQFGLSAKEMPNIADKIAGAANASAIDVSDFGTSMTQAGAVAHLVGLSFDDTALAITAMGNAGIKGSDAGTSLKSFLSMLQPTTKKQTELMSELGIITKKGGNEFFTAAGKIKPMAQMSDVLGKALKGMSEQQKMATLKTLFGSDAIRAAAIIAGQGSKGFDKLGKSIDKVKAADVAATRLDNVKGSMEALKGSFETLMIGLGSLLLPALKKLTDGFTKVINVFSALSPGMQKFIVIGALVTGGLLLLVGGFIKMFFAVQKIISVIKILRTVQLASNLAFLASPIFWIIVAIIALVVAIVLLYKKNKAFRDFINGMWAGIKKVIGAVVGWITGTAVPWIVGAWNAIKDGAVALWNGIVSVWNAIVGAITWAINMVKTVITTVVGAIVGFWVGVWNGIVAVISFVFNLIKTIITTYIMIWLTIIRTVLNIILAVWRAIWGVFGGLITAVFNLIKTIIQVALAWIMVIIRTVMNVILTIWRTVWNVIKTVVTTVWNAIYAVVSAVVNRVRSVITTVFNAIKGVVSSVFNAIWGTIKTVWNGIYNTISAVVTRVVSVVTGLVTSIKNIFTGVGTWLFDAGKNLIMGLVNGIKSVISAVTGAIGGITDKIKSFLPGSPIKEGPLVAWNDGSPGKKLVQLVAGGIEANVGLLDKAFSGMSVGMPNILTSPNVAVSASASRTGAGGVSSGAPSGQPAANAGPVTRNVEITVNNPKPEPASDSLQRTYSKIAYLGLDAKGA